MTDYKLLDEFLKEENLRRRPRGLRIFRTRIPKLFSYLKDSDIKLNEVKIKEALAYQGWLCQYITKKGKRYDKSTINNFIVCAVSFYEFLKKRGIVYTNPFAEIRKVRVDKKLPKNILKEKDMSLFLDKLGLFNEGETLKHNITKYRVHIIAELMYGSGLRIAEVADLKVSDIDFTKNLVTVMEGKHGKRRIAYLNEYAKEILKIYIEKVRVHIFNSWNEANGDLLFGTKWETLEKVVNRTLKKVSKEIGLMSFTSHGFRHALGYHLHRAGCNIRYIQSILGHARLKTTEVYVKVDKEKLKDALDNYHPRSRWIRIRDERI